MTKVPAKVPNTAQVSAPAVLMEYQQKWVADPSPFKVFEKSRRTGITWAEAADDVLIAASNRNVGGQNVYYIAYNQDMTIEYIQAAAMWARVYNYAASEVEDGFWDGEDEDKHIKTFTIRFPDSGFRIVALTSRPSNLRGRQGVIVIDEAAFHDKLSELLKAAMAMLIWGGKVRIISTHDGTENPFNELITDIRAEKRSGSVHRVTFQEAVADGLYRRVCLRLGKEWKQEEELAWIQSVYSFYGVGAQEELDCIPSNSSGAWLSRALIESRMSSDTPVLRWECKQGFELLPEHIRKAECQDWLQEHLAPRLEALPNFIGGAFDARGNGQFLAEFAMQRYGPSRIQQVMLTEGWYREHMPPVKAALEDGNLDKLPKDEDFLGDLRLVQVIKGVPRIPDTRTSEKSSSDGREDVAKRHGDAAVALALAYFASREMTKGPVKALTRPRSRSKRVGGINLIGYEHVN